MSALSRRSLFTGGRSNVIRPPWAVAEQSFVDACTRCGTCVEACPSGLLTRGRGGFPTADFSSGNGCDFCGACAQACSHGAIDRAARQAGAKPWSAVAAVAPNCLDQQGTNCRACEDSCTEAAIRFRPALGGRTLVAVDADRCTGCGLCLPRCPVGALQVS